MRQRLADFQALLASVIAEEKRFTKHAESERTSASEWKRRGEMARRSGNEQLASEADIRAAQHEAAVEPLQSAHQAMTLASNNAKLAMRRLIQSMTLINERTEMLQMSWEAERATAIAQVQQLRGDAYNALNNAGGAATVMLTPPGRLDDPPA